MLLWKQSCGIKAAAEGTELYVQRSCTGRARPCKKEKEQAERAYEEASKEAKRAGKARDEAQALQKRYRQDLPKQKEQALQCRQKYEARMAAFGLTTEQWQAVTQQYPREEADLFQEKLDAHKAQQAQAQGRLYFCEGTDRSPGKTGFGSIAAKPARGRTGVEKPAGRAGAVGHLCPCQQ